MTRKILHASLIAVAVGALAAACTFVGEPTRFELCGLECDG